MKANLDCMRDVLCYIYNNIDELGRIRLADIEKACHGYAHNELTGALNRMFKAGMISVLPLPGGLVVVDITPDGVTCMKNLME